MESVGLVGIFISITLIVYIIYKTFNIILKNNINNYQKFIEYIMPEILSLTINNIINIFLLISFNIMVAGFATYFNQELGISKWYGAILIAILTFVILSSNINGVIKINTYLIPIIIILIIFLGIKKIEFTNLIISQDINNHIYWIFSSILYASYNSITLIPILISLKNNISTKKESLLLTIFITFIMIILSVLIFLLMNSYISEINSIEIPIIYIANTLGESARYIYGIVILMAIFTTAICSGYGFLSNVTKSKKSYMICSGIISIISIIIGQIGFASLVNLLYPIFGYLGIIQLILLIIRKTS